MAWPNSLHLSSLAPGMRRWKSYVTAAAAGGVHTSATRARHCSCLTSNGAVHALDHEVGGLIPPQVSQHHLAGENHGTGVDLQQRGVASAR
jgi:hypothetical protein